MNTLRSHDEYSAQELKGITQKDDHLQAVIINDCTFLRCAFNETFFQSCQFSHCTFKDCDLSLVKLKDSSFTNTRFEHCRLIGVNWTDTTWSRNRFVHHADFVDCILNLSTFSGLDMKKTTLTRCVAREVDFTDANLSQSLCTHSDFSASRFIHTNLTEADFSGASNYTIPASLNTLKKTKFSLPEAMSLLYSLDIILVDADAER